MTVELIVTGAALPTRTPQVYMKVPADVSEVVSVLSAVWVVSPLVVITMDPPL